MVKSASLYKHFIAVVAPGIFPLMTRDIAYIGIPDTGILSDFAALFQRGYRSGWKVLDLIHGPETREMHRDTG